VYSIKKKEVKIMRDIWVYMQVVFAAIGGWLGWYLGGFDGFLHALVVFMVMDYLLGVMCAIVEKHLSSDIGAEGIFRKVMIFSLVGVAHVLDSYVIGDGNVLRTAIIFFYLSNEGISIIENVTRLGLPVPPKLKEILEQLNDGGANK
jgi:toxin secretion/phage lysis holin